MLSWLKLELGAKRLGAGLAEQSCTAVCSSAAFGSVRSPEGTLSGGTR